MMKCSLCEDCGKLTRADRGKATTLATAVVPALHARGVTYPIRTGRHGYRMASGRSSTRRAGVIDPPTKDGAAGFDVASACRMIGGRVLADRNLNAWLHCERESQNNCRGGRLAGHCGMDGRVGYRSVIRAIEGLRRCAIYSITTNQAAIIALFRAVNRAASLIPTPLRASWSRSPNGPLVELFVRFKRRGYSDTCLGNEPVNVTSARQRSSHGRGYAMVRRRYLHGPD
jgi:hypothetical protein